VKIKALTMWYNEEFLAPYFLKHYSYLDEIHIIMDADTSDNSIDVAYAHPNVTVEQFRFPDGMDDIIKCQKLNQVMQGMLPTCDWLYVLDADEFIWPHGCENPRDFLARQTGANVVIARMWQVYRNAVDSDLSLMIEPVPFNRRYGDPNRETGSNSMYNKPIIIKGGTECTLDLGNHRLFGQGLTVGQEYYDGVHWANADPEFAIERRVKNRRDRQSKVNLQYQLTVQHHNITEESVRAELDSHLHDPKLF